MTHRTVDPPNAPPRTPQRGFWVVKVPDPPRRFTFSFVYRLGAGVINLAFVLVFFTIVGALNGWRMTPTMIVVQGALIVVLTAVSEGLLGSVYQRYRRRQLERGRERAAEGMIELTRVTDQRRRPAPAASTRYPLFKRAFDILASSLVLVVSAPTLALIAMLIKLESRGPVFVRLLRVGPRGEIFPVYKFRTRRFEGEPLSRPRPSIEDWDDPSLTPVGGMLRRYSLDEIPQLVNVLKGDMSLVGPRPLDPESLQQVPHAVKDAKSGLIGPGVFMSLSNPKDIAAWERMTEEYVRNRSWSLDLRILSHAIRSMLRGLRP